MMGWIYFFLMLGDIGLVLLQLYFIISYSDLEHDYTSPYDLCQLMDKWYPLEVYAQSAVFFVLLLCREWTSVLVFLPVVLFNAYVYTSRTFKFDATSIFRQLTSLKAEAFAKMAYYVICFCYLLYSMIWWLVVHSE